MVTNPCRCAEAPDAPSEPPLPPRQRRYQAPIEIGIIDKPELKDDPVLVAVHAASINPIDDILRSGQMRGMMPLARLAAWQALILNWTLEFAVYASAGIALWLVYLNCLSALAQRR